MHSSSSLAALAPTDFREIASYDNTKQEARTQEKSVKNCTSWALLTEGRQGEIARVT